MSRPIKETPILTGKDSKVFQQRMRNVEKVSSLEYNRMLRNYDTISKLVV